jgi:hypothetical protein
MGMSKRYTYFRTEKGTLYKGRDGKYAPVHLLSDLGKKATLNPEGSVSWQGTWMPLQVQPALRSAFAVIGPNRSELNATDTWRIVWQALVETVKKAPGQPVHPHKLLIAADKAAATYFRLTPNPYVLVTSLSVEALPEATIALRDCTVSALAKRGTEFPLPDVLSPGMHGAAFASHLDASRYQLVKVDTKGRSIHEAAENALNAVNVLRAVWSLLATFRSLHLRGGMPSRKPLGVIHTGPVHTLHHPDGRPVEENLYWYDPEYTEDWPLFEREKLSQLDRHRKEVMGQLEALPYRAELEALLVRYAGALDQQNPDIAFLQMWSILEKLTDTVGSNYDQTIKRTVWPYNKESRCVAREILESLRYRRNQYVHSAASAEDAEQCAYLIKSFVDPHLVKLLVNEFEVRSLKEYGKVLALPTSVTTLEEGSRRLARAIKAQGGTGSSKDGVAEPKEEASSMEPKHEEELMDWKRRLDAWMASVAARAARYPKGFVVDDSREAIYEGREE